jgi:uncharacterized protein
LDIASILLYTLTALVLAVAVVYSAAGLGGASGYFAVFALFGSLPAAVRPTVLTLSILVALIGSFRYYREGFFSWRTFWPFAAGSAPAAFLVSNLALPRFYPFFYRLVVVLIILYSAARLLFRIGDDRKTAPVPIWIALPIGAAIGSLTGFTGVGGGIFLGPLLLVMHWAKPEESLGVTAAFILVNSVAALSTNVSVLLLLPPNAVYWAPAAIVGGWVGTELGLRGRPFLHLRPLLAVLFVIGGLRLLVGA